MIRPRWRKVLRDLLGNKTRTLLVVLSIAVGAFAVGVISNAQTTLPRDLMASYRASDPADAVLFTEPFEDELVEVVRNVRGVQNAEGRRNLTARLQVGPDTWQSIQIFAIPDFDDITINKIQPAGGEWPPSERSLLIERASLEMVQANVDEQVLLEMPDGELRTMRISGLAHDVSQQPPFFTGRTYGYVTFDTLEWLGLPRDFNELHITIDDERDTYEQRRAITEEVRSKVERSGRQVFSANVPRELRHPVDALLQTMIVLLSVLGVVSFLLSGFLVVNTVTALIAQQTRQIGVMKAIGANNTQLMGMYLSVVLIYGFLSLVIALPLAAIAAYLFSNYAAGLLNFDLTNFSVPPQTLLLQIVVALLVPLLAALYPVGMGVRITVREAITANGSGGKQFGTGVIDWVLERLRFLSRPVLLSLRNTFRRKSRLVLTLTTLMLAGATFIAVMSVRSSMLLTVQDFARYWNYDVIVNFAAPQRSIEVEAEARRIPGVVETETWAFASARRMRPDQSESDNVIMIGTPAATRMIQPTVVEGRWLLPEDERAVVVNTEFLRDEPDLKVGDDLQLVIDGREFSWRIVGVVQGVLTGPNLYANAPHLAQVNRSVGRASALLVITEQHDQEAQTRIAQMLEERLKGLGVSVASWQATSTQRAQLVSQFDLVIVFMLIMGFLLTIVGGLGLMGTISINVLERTREIGVMRAIGATDITVLKVVVSEGVVMGLISWFLALLLSLPLSRLLSDQVGIAFTESPLTYTFSSGGLLLWLIIVTVLAVISSLPPAFSAARITVRDALAYE
jgi:putative ABC transport system permease protein